MKIGYLMQAGVPDVRQRPLSGPAIHVKHVFDELVRLGHHVRLLGVLDGRIWKSDDLEHFEPVIVRWVDKGGFRLFERGVRRIQFELKLPYAALFESLRFAQACRQELAAYDLFYERMGWVGYGGALAARWLESPLILEVNGDHLTEMEMQGTAPQGVQRRLSTFLMKQAVIRSSHAIATGEGWRRRYIERWGVDSKKVTVVENGSELVDLLSRNQLRSFHPDPNLDGVTTIAYSGAFDPWQGVTILIRAVARVVARGMPARLLLIGSGREVQTAEQLVHELHLEQFVTFTGRLAPPQYAESLAQADIGVSPYCGRVEYSGLKLLDYKAAGLATIASGQDNEPAVIVNGKTGLIVPPRDENALYEAILHIISDVKLRKQMGRTARVEAEQFHGWNITAERLNELITQVFREYSDRRIEANGRNVLKLA